MFRRMTCLFAVTLIFAAVVCRAADTEKEKAAVVIAQKWLTIVDEEKYAESWKETAAYFKNAVTMEQWEQSLQAHRKPYGKLISRQEKSASYTTTLPGAPDGQYVVIEFESSFENKKYSVETVTPMMDKDGVWRVSGYFIK